MLGIFAKLLQYLTPEEVFLLFLIGHACKLQFSTLSIPRNCRQHQF